jgi:uncharacterized membrane protein
LPAGILGAAMAAPLFGYLTGQVSESSGEGRWLALCLLILQAAAAVILLEGRRIARLAVLGLLAIGGLGAWRSPGTSLALTAGATHAIAYGVLAWGFAASLLPGRHALITSLARRINPRFRPEMEAYTRRLTWAWCGCFGAELVASAGLLLLGPAGWWQAFVSLWHAAPVLALFVGEHLIRRRVFPGEIPTATLAVLRGIRKPQPVRPAAAAASVLPLAAASPRGPAADAEGEATPAKPPQQSEQQASMHPGQ